MNKKRLYSPEIDRIIEWIGYRSSNASVSAPVTAQIIKTYEVLQQIAPVMDGKDKIWTLWLRSERGDISAYGDFEEFKEEGEADSYAEFESRWQEEYPDDVKWHSVTLQLYEERLFFNIDAKCRFEADLQTKKIIGADVHHDEVKDFIAWLLAGTEEEVRTFVKNPARYNKFIAENLPLQKRLGKIKRLELWESVDDFIREDKELGAENLRKFAHVVNNLNENRSIAQLSANDFLRYCEIGYEANGYFKDTKKKLSLVQKYEAFADGRHGGLLDIDPDSPEAFRKWYESGKWSGTHPWEISRGGNTTHISLQVARTGEGWKLYLDGFHRAVETAKMAIALFENDTPFVMHRKEELLRKLQGNDAVGIVPDNIMPRYCHSMFPAEDQIQDFLNPWLDPELAAVVKARATWYPVEALHLA